MRRQNEQAGRTATIEPRPNALLAGGFLTVQEAANYLRLSRAKIYCLMDAGELQFAKFGKSRRILRRALEQYVDKSMVG